MGRFAVGVTIKHDRFQSRILVNKPWFVYNNEDGLYYRYEFKDKQIDGANEKQLAVKNILVQYCEWSKKDENPQSSFYCSVALASDNSSSVA